MNLFNMPYNKRYLIHEKYKERERVCFEKVYFPHKNVDQYFIKIFKLDKSGTYLCDGYIYFYLNLLNKESNFIGLWIKPERRNEGLAQVLISYWVNLCLENGIYNLNTIHKQRKPFTLYLLKKFKFDLLNIKLYESSSNTISICKFLDKDDKCLYFKNSLQAATFKNSKILESDNYLILDSLNEDTKVLNHILLSTLYTSKDNDEASKRSLKLIDKFENN